MTTDNDRLQAIRARRAAIANATLWKDTTPDQPEKQPGFWLAYAMGPAYPAYDQSEIDTAWNKAQRDQEIINALPADVDFLLSEVARLEAENAALREDKEALKAAVGILQIEIDAMRRARLSHGITTT